MSELFPVLPSEIPQKQLRQMVPVLLAAQECQDKWPDPKDSNIYLEATLAETDMADRAGGLMVRRQPAVDQEAFLEMSYLEHGYGEQRAETETLYAMRRSLDGTLSLYVSDTVELAEIDPTTATDIYVDEDEETGAIRLVEDVSGELFEGLTQETQELDLTLELATTEDYQKLMALLQCATDGGFYAGDPVSVQLSPEELEEVNAEYDGYLADISFRRWERAKVALGSVFGRLSGRGSSATDDSDL